MYYSKEMISKLAAIPIESVASALGLSVAHHSCSCPCHEDCNPSMRFYATSNRFFCFSCCKGGNIIDLVRMVLNVGFTEACNWLSAHAGVSRQVPSVQPFGSESGNSFDASRYAKYFEHPFLNRPASDFLFNQRHLRPEVVRWCRLSSWTDRQGNPWLQIPYYDIEGNLGGVQWRNLNSQLSALSSQPRFRFPYGSKCHIYNLPILKRLREGDELWIAEGCSDCWSLMSGGHKAIAIPSATLLKSKDLEPLSTLGSKLSTSFHMYPDRDAPGERLYRQLCMSLPVVRHSLPENYKDYSELYLKKL